MRRIALGAGLAGLIFATTAQAASPPSVGLLPYEISSPIQQELGALMGQKAWAKAWKMADAGVSAPIVQHGAYRVAFACTPLNCGSDHTVWVFGQQGYWASLTEHNHIVFFGNPDDAVKKILSGNGT